MPSWPTRLRGSGSRWPGRPSAQAEESLRIVQDRYDAGLTTIVELLDSETALTASRTNLTRTLYDATVSQARLDLSLGQLDRARF